MTNLPLDPIEKVAAMNGANRTERTPRATLRLRNTDLVHPSTQSNPPWVTVLIPITSNNNGLSPIRRSCRSPPWKGKNREEEGRRKGRKKGKTEGEKEGEGKEG